MAVRIVENTAMDLEVGDEQVPLEFTVTAELNQQYLFGLADFHPRYVEEGPWGKPIAHPALLLNMTNRTRSPSFKLPPGWGSIHARDETEFLAPARVGDTLTVCWTVVDVYERKGRPYQALESTVTNELGQRIMRRVAHSTVSRPERAVTGKDGGAGGIR